MKNNLARKSGGDWNSLYEMKEFLIDSYGKDMSFKKLEVLRDNYKGKFEFELCKIVKGLYKMNSTASGRPYALDSFLIESFLSR